MTTDLIAAILEGIELGKSLKRIATEQFYSQKTIERIILRNFGVGYNTLFHLIYTPIVVHAIRSTPNLTSAASELNISSQGLCNYVSRHLSTSPTKLKEENSMKESKRSMKEVLLIMTQQQKNITLLQLGIDSSFIKDMRRAGVPIVSVPGRSGGYNLERTSSANCLRWINNIRRSKKLEPLKKLY